MPTIFQINQCLNFSTGRIAQSIGDCAIDAGWKSYIAYSSREPLCPSKSEIIKVGSSIDPYLHYLGHKLFDREGLESKGATRKLISQIKTISPEIVHLHNIHDHWLNYPILFEYLNKSNIQVVWTFHDCWAFTGHCFHFVTKNCNKWQTMCGQCPLRHEYPSTICDRSEKNYILKRKYFKNCNNLTIVSCSKWIQDLVNKSFLGDKPNQVIYNGVDTKVFRPIANKNPHHPIVLAVANVWNKNKGLYDIYKLRESLPDNYTIKIIGLDKTQLSKLPNNIHGVERTNSLEELVALYSQANVLINPTYADTFPTVNIEALACGTPVITYKTGGSPESVDEKTGIVVNQGDILSMANAIIDVTTNTENFTSLSCRIKAENQFNKDVQFHKYIELYESLQKKYNHNKDIF